MVLKQRRENTDALIVDASKGFIKKGKDNALRTSDIKRIVDTVKAREDVAKYARVVSREEIRENDYNLNIPRYVDSSETAETWDIYASMFGGIPKSEIDALAEYWQTFPDLKSVLFEDDGGDHVQITDGDITKIIREHIDIQAFKQCYKDALQGFDAYLYDRLILDLNTVRVSQEENRISEEIFRRLKGVPLVDRYVAYQLLSDRWEAIEGDIEILQTESFSAAKRVDPNMVVKKRAGKDVEVQEGWTGRVLPFDLVQEVLLTDELQALKQKEDRINDVKIQQEELLESLSEDDKEELSEILNDDNTAFLTAPLNRLAKSLVREYGQTYDEESLDGKVITVQKLIDEEKSLNKAIKDGQAKLHAKTKTVIENLSDEEVLGLLNAKWIEPLLHRLNELPVGILDRLASKVQALVNKYDTTLADIESEIKETEASLIAMLDQLVGNESDMAGLNEFKALLGGI